MRSVTILSALVAVGSRAVSGATTCSEEIRITEPTPIINCDVIDANVVVDENVAGSLSIEGPKQLKKDLIVSNATKLISISSTSINAVGGTLRLESLQLLSSCNLQALTSVVDMMLLNLPQLNGLTLGTEGVTKARRISIADTFISDLTGLNIANCETIDISNNPKLTTFDSPLVNVTKSLKLTNNGNNMQVNMSSLQNCGEIQFRQVKSFDAPVLSRAESIKFNDSPELLSVSCSNLTEIAASLTLINNKKLNRLSFPLLKTIKGDMTIQNNTALQQVDGFPKVESVGNILLRGNFRNVTLDQLRDVKGSAIATSTTDISAFCDFFSDLKKKGNIRGKESCTSNNKNANEEGGTGGQTSTDKEKDAAGIVSVNSALLSMAVLATLAQMVL
ncbi:hypothetical protein XA68_16739 [Ophiocordyceps unilateralis]|uniref:Receptor L-domain domain-containing protein n=1 Tax=Ophiocordyceps unilateralis TaxID=268505 RepID=A0A2A9PL98_OPHUN|nr:hypothetical protein XA68_16739 [Ophiocordyceps unilateralis]